jgi:hypothetical protein
MKPRDLIIRGPQFFGNLFPGMMIVAAFLILTQKRHLLVLESGNPLVRIGIFLTVSYVLGYTTQTLILMTVREPLAKWIDDTALMKKWIGKVKDVIDKRMEIFGSEGWQREWLDSEKGLPKRLPDFCKWYVLEYSTELKIRLLDYEDAINFITAAFLPFPFLVWAVFFRWHNAILDWLELSLGLSLSLHQAYRILVVIIIAIVYMFWRRLRVSIQSEREQACAMFLLLLDTSGNNEGSREAKPLLAADEAKTEENGG